MVTEQFNILSPLSLHDCMCNEIKLENNNLTFFFNDGFDYLDDMHQPIQTESGSLTFHLIDRDLDSDCFYICKTELFNREIREKYSSEQFIEILHNKKYTLEFLYSYFGYRSIIFKCCLWFDHKPYHRDCEIELSYDEATFTYEI